MILLRLASADKFFDWLGLGDGVRNWVVSRIIHLPTV